MNNIYHSATQINIVLIEHFKSIKSLQFILKNVIQIVIANFYYHINLLLGWKEEEHILIAELMACFMKTLRNICTSWLFFVRNSEFRVILNYVPAFDFK